MRTPLLRQGRMQTVAAGAVMRVNARVAAHAGVDQQESGGMVDEVTQAGLDLRRAGTGLRGRAHEVAEVDSADCQICHQMSVPASRATPGWPGVRPAQQVGIGQAQATGLQ